MKRNFTTEELEKLKEAEEHFNTVINGSYKRATSTRLDTMVADIYEAATGEKVHRNFSCGVCSYNLYLKVGTKYYRDIKESEPKAVNDCKSAKNGAKKNNKATKSSTK